MQSNILELIFAGESDVLELKSSIRDPQVLARLMGAFANGQGGKVIIGVTEPPEIVGVDERLTRLVYEAARHRLAPEPKSTLTFMEAEGQRIAVVDVERSDDVVLSEGSAFVRTGAMIQPMAWTQMRKHLPETPSVATIESLTKSVERQSKLIVEMREDIRESNSWQVRWKERAFAFVLGVVASLIASFVYSRFPVDHPAQAPDSAASSPSRGPSGAIPSAARIQASGS